MYTTQLFISAIMATGILAAPPTTKSQLATANQWTVENMKRVCVDNNAKCTWTFAINTGSTDTACTFVVPRKGDTPSYQAPGGPSKCGPYTITSGWSNQFGSDPAHAFTVLSVADQSKSQIIYPGYTDQELSHAQTVKPNKSYPVQNIPN